MAQLSLPIQCQSDREWVNAVIVYGNKTYPMLPIPTADVVEATTPRWSNGVQLVLMMAAGVLTLLVLALLVLRTIL